MDLYIALKYSRRIAKSNEYQTILSGAKEYGFRLFDNLKDFSAIQFHFLGMLNFYATISMDVYLGEIDEKVFEDEVYEDAYMYYRAKEKDRKKREAEKNAHNSAPMKSIEQVSQKKSEWKFRRK